MTQPNFRSLCAELLAEYEDSFVISEPSDDPLVQRARAALATPPPEPLRPIPVSERLPEPKDCDLHWRCWGWNTNSCRSWELVYEGMISYPHEDYTHWLPCDAFPIPEVTQ